MRGHIIIWLPEVVTHSTVCMWHAHRSVLHRLPVPTYEIMDFFTFLPPELLLKIFFYLQVTDSLKLRQVSRRWNQIITSLNSYWQRAVLQLGISTATLEHRCTSISLPSILAAGLKHRKWIKSCGSQIGIFSDRTDHLVSCNRRKIGVGRRIWGIQSNAASNGFYLGHSMVLISPQQPPQVQRILTVSMVVQDFEPLRISCTFYCMIVWARATKDFVLILLHSGEWLCFSQYSDTVLLHWKCKLCKHNPRTTRTVTDSVTHISCCDECFLVACIEASSPYSPIWTLHLFKIGHGNVSPDLATRRTILVQLKPNESLIQWVLLPKSKTRDETGFCQEHSLLYQTSTQIYVFKVNFSESEGKTVIQSHQISIPSSDLHNVDPSTNLHSVISIRLSTDQKLLATMIDPYHLYIWETSTWNIVTSKHLLWISLRDTVSHLASIIAVGYLYTVISTGNQQLGFNIHIIGTHSGELISERLSKVNWWRKDAVDYVCLVNEDWLSDMHCFNSPVFAYLNCSQDELMLSYVQFLQLKKPGSLL